MPKRPRLDLSPAAWAVLGAVAESPTYGFAVASLLSTEGALGRVWTLPRPMVYRELGKLVELGLVAERFTEPGRRGPTRTIVAVTPAGRRAVKQWLRQPVEHVREVRSLLLLKLALLQRAGIDTRPLLQEQLERFAPQSEGLQKLCDGADGFDRLLAQWRLASSQAALEFLSAALADADGDGK
jgi:DNA-binding PadR family transcriptional regulator